MRSGLTDKEMVNGMESFVGEDLETYITGRIGTKFLGIITTKIRDGAKVKTLRLSNGHKLQVYEQHDGDRIIYQTNKMQEEFIVSEGKYHRLGWIIPKKKSNGKNGTETE